MTRSFCLKWMYSALLLCRWPGFRRVLHTKRHQYLDITVEKWILLKQLHLLPSPLVGKIAIFLLTITLPSILQWFPTGIDQHWYCCSNPWYGIGWIVSVFRKCSFGLNGYLIWVTFNCLKVNRWIIWGGGVVPPNGQGFKVRLFVVSSLG